MIRLTLEYLAIVAFFTGAAWLFLVFGVGAP